MTSYLWNPPPPLSLPVRGKSERFPMPRVGQGKKANVFYNTGHGHLGWTLSAGTAEMIAEVISARQDRAVIATLPAGFQAATQPA
jgi:glycine/D-amino acid oxidase-like deaminating enzyme